MPESFYLGEKGKATFTEHLLKTVMGMWWLSHLIDKETEAQKKTFSTLPKVSGLENVGISCLMRDISHFVMHLGIFAKNLIMTASYLSGEDEGGCSRHSEGHSFPPIKGRLWLFQVQCTWLPGANLFFLRLQV